MKKRIITAMVTRTGGRVWARSSSTGSRTSYARPISSTTWRACSTGSASTATPNRPPAWPPSGGKLFEVHGHFAYYGDYFNEAQDKWIDIIMLERVCLKFGKQKNAQEVWDWVNTHTPAEIPAFIEGKKPADYTPAEADRRVFTTRAFVKKYVNELAARGVNPFWYFNYTDGFRPIMEKRWKSSIARNEDGSYQAGGWMMCHNLNSDPKYPFRFPDPYP